MRKLALLLAVMMLVCAGASAATVSGENEYPIVSEPLTIRAWMATRADRDVENCDMTKFIEEKTGIDIHFDLFTTSDIDTAYNLLIAGGDWPDILLDPWLTTNMVVMGAEAGMLLPLNDLIEEHGYNYKQVLEDNPGYRSMLTAPDGNIYTFMYTDSGVHKDSEYKMWVKQEWLDKLGLEIPATTDEFKDLLLAIKNNDVNGNGDPNDEIPLMGFYNGRKSDPICFLMNPFELYTDNLYYITDEGEIYFSAITDGWREGLKYIADLYAEGLIAEETYVQDDTQFRAILNKTAPEAVVGVFPFWYQGAIIDTSVLKWTDYEPIPPLMGDAGIRQSAARYGGNFNMVGAITTSCENPEAAFKLLDWLIGEEGIYVGIYGVEGQNYEWVDEPSFYGDARSIRRITSDVDTVWNSGSFPRADRASIRYAISMDPSMINVDNTYVLVHAAQAYEPYYVNHHIPDVVWCSDEDVNLAVSNYAATIGPYIRSSNTQFVMGVKDINDDAAWEAYLTELDNMGLEDYIDNLMIFYGLEQ